MADDSIFRQLAFDFGEAIRDGQGERPDTPAPLPWAALYDLLGPFSHFVRAVFERMEIAGQLIEEKKPIYPCRLTHRSILPAALRHGGARAGTTPAVPKALRRDYRPTYRRRGYQAGYTG